MVRLTTATFLSVAAFAGAAYAQGYTKDCGEGLGPCPENKPCCSQYGQCGVGAFCLGGCDPKHSFELGSCAPAPVCKSHKNNFESGIDTVIDKTKYLGDASKHDWVADGKPAAHNGNLLLTMAEGSVGTVLASTHYVWYGKISATLKTSRGAGVVSAFIMMSDMKDEIDYEWVGVDLETVQTNFYYQGIPDYTNGANISLSDTYNNYHTYEIDWQPDQITWSVDGQVGRTLKRSDTFNETSKEYSFPQTPSRVQFSLWPGGLATNDIGTIEWAGGEIQWDHEEVQKNGYYYVSIKDISIECYDPPATAKKTGDVSYIYDDIAGREKNVVISNKKTVLKSLLGTGTDMDKVSASKKPATPSATAKPKTDDEDKDDSSSSSKPKTDDEEEEETDEEVETIPGATGAGFGSHSDQLTGVVSEDGTTEGTSTTDGSTTSESSTDAEGDGFDQGISQGNDAGSGASALHFSSAAVAAGVLALFAL